MVNLTGRPSLKSRGHLTPKKHPPQQVMLEALLSFFSLHHDPVIRNWGYFPKSLGPWFKPILPTCECISKFIQRRTLDKEAGWKITHFFNWRYIDSIRSHFPASYVSCLPECIQRSCSSSAFRYFQLIPFLGVGGWYTAGCKIVPNPKLHRRKAAKI